MVAHMRSDWVRQAQRVRSARGREEVEEQSGRVDMHAGGLGWADNGSGDGSEPWGSIPFEKHLKGAGGNLGVMGA